MNSGAAADGTQNLVANVRTRPKQTCQHFKALRVVPQADMRLVVIPQRSELSFRPNRTKEPCANTQPPSDKAFAGHSVMRACVLATA